MRRRKGEKTEFLEEPMINLTPLIDVVFVILFTFIVVAPLLEVDRISLAKGSPLKTKEPSPSPITIHVDKEGVISYNLKETSLEQLEEALYQAKTTFPKAVPQLFYDKEATFGTYQSIKNAIEAAGFQNLDVILKSS